MGTMKHHNNHHQRNNMKQKKVIQYLYYKVEKNPANFSNAYSKKMSPKMLGNFPPVLRTSLPKVC